MQQKLNNKNYKYGSLEEYGKEIRRVWGHYIVERPCLYTWLHVVEHASAASEGVRKHEWDIVLKETGKVIIWWLAFIGKLNDLKNSEGEELIFAIPFSPSQIIWSKYPGVCPVDFGLYVSETKHKKVRWEQIGQIPCRCLARKSEVEVRTQKEKAYAKQQLWKFSLRFKNRCPESILNMESMFRRIFRPQAFALSTEEVAFHFLEEVGEVSRALVDVSRSHKRITNGRKRDALVRERVVVLKGLTEELADVFSWTMTLVNRVRLDLSSFDRYFATGVGREGQILSTLREALGRDAAKVNVADILWRRFGIEGEFRCDECKKAVCQCGDTRAVTLQGKAFEKAKPALNKGLLEVCV